MLRHRAARLLVCWLVAVGFATFYPFIPVHGGPPPIGPAFWKLRPVLFDVVDNLILFMPLGLLLRSAGEGVAASLILGALLSGAIELGQLEFQYRIASFQDVLLNAAGSVLGTLLYPRLSPHLAKLDRPRVRQVLTGFVLLGVAATASPPIVTPALWLWDGRATFRVPENAQDKLRSRYDVTRAEVYVGALSPHVLREDARVWRLGEATSSTAAAAIFAQGAFTVDLDVAPARDPGDDLVIVLSFTSGAPRRNFGVAFDDDVVLFGTSTRVTTWYGSLPSGEVPFRSAPMPPGTHRITLSFDGEVVRAFLDGVPWQEARIALPPHNGLRRVWLAWSPAATLLYAFVVAFFAAAAWSRPGTLASGLALGIATGVAVELVQALMFVRMPDMGALAASLVGAALGAFSTGTRRR